MSDFNNVGNAYIDVEFNSSNLDRSANQAQGKANIALQKMELRAKKSAFRHEQAIDKMVTSTTRSVERMLKPMIRFGQVGLVAMAGLVGYSVKLAIAGTSAEKSWKRLQSTVKNLAFLGGRGLTSSLGKAFDKITDKLKNPQVFSAISKMTRNLSENIDKINWDTVFDRLKRLGEFIMGFISPFVQFGKVVMTVLSGMSKVLSGGFGKAVGYATALLYTLTKISNLYMGLNNIGDAFKNLSLIKQQSTVADNALAQRQGNIVNPTQTTQGFTPAVNANRIPLDNYGNPKTSWTSFTDKIADYNYGGKTRITLPSEKEAKGKANIAPLSRFRQRELDAQKAFNAKMDIESPINKGTTPLSQANKNSANQNIIYNKNFDASGAGVKANTAMNRFATMMDKQSVKIGMASTAIGVSLMALSSAFDANADKLEKKGDLKGAGKERQIGQASGFVGSLLMGGGSGAMIGGPIGAAIGAAITSGIYLYANRDGIKRNRLQSKGIDPDYKSPADKAKYNYYEEYKQRNNKSLESMQMQQTMMTEKKTSIVTGSGAWGRQMSAPMGTFDSARSELKTQIDLLKKIEKAILIDKNIGKIQSTYRVE